MGDTARVLRLLESRTTCACRAPSRQVCRAEAARATPSTRPDHYGCEGHLGFELDAPGGPRR